jgi:phosphopantothenoylcysteine decarboxylase
MPSFGSDTGNVLYLLVCAAPPARQAADLVKLGQDAGWDVCVIATPAAVDWIDAGHLLEVTGHPVRTTVRRPDELEFRPLGDAVLLAPATFNTINKWAAGINDSLCLGLLNEALGRSVPAVVCPWVNDALSSHPAYKAAKALLRSAGAHFAETDQSAPQTFAQVALDFLEKVTSGTRPPIA